MNIKDNKFLHTEKREEERQRRDERRVEKERLTDKKKIGQRVNIQTGRHRQRKKIFMK